MLINERLPLSFRRLEVSVDNGRAYHLVYAVLRVCSHAAVANNTCRLVHRFFMVCDPVVTPSVSGMWSCLVASATTITPRNDVFSHHLIGVLGRSHGNRVPDSRNFFARHGNVFARSGRWSVGIAYVLESKFKRHSVS